MEIQDFMEKYKVLHNLKRFGMESVIHPQDLTSHGYGVGTLFYLLCEMFGVEITVEDLFVVMNHDFAETYTGDINRRVKEKDEVTKEAWKKLEQATIPISMIVWTDEMIEEHLGDENRITMFEIADILDAILYCQMEREKGNTLLLKAEKAYVEKLLSYRDKTPNYVVFRDILYSLDIF